MIKAAIIACIACASGTLLLASSTTKQQSLPDPGGRSFQELHANAHLENLPVADMPGSNSR